MRRPVNWLCAAASLTSLGCSTRLSTQSDEVVAVEVKAAEGAVIDVSAEQIPALAGTRLVIPPGALSEDTSITIATQTEPIVGAIDAAAGPVAVFGPPGIRFAGGAVLALPYVLTADQSADALYVDILEDDGVRAQVQQPELTIDRATSTGSLVIGGFTRFQHGIHGCPSENHPCPDGYRCERGRCVVQPVEHCHGGVDDDGDGLADCADSDCAEDCPPPAEACGDGIDNDGDGFADCDDGQCANLAICVPPVERCADGVDNDSDGLVDCDDALDCPLGPSNAHCAVESCRNGNDDDYDAFADCADADCAAAAHCLPPEICDDQVDNDGDGFIDCDDSGCAGQAGCSCAPTGEICDDGADNDCDGLVDCDDAIDCAPGPDAMHCAVEDCQNGGDDDWDGLADCGDGECAADPGCHGLPPEQCSDGVDNDRDGKSDCTDVDCAAYCVCITQLEVCDDGQDNDCDAHVDCSDPGCSSSAVCAPAVELCNDQLDNDRDGATDCHDADCAADASCCTPASSNEVGFCSDGLDNDCDGVADCDDAIDCPPGAHNIRCYVEDCANGTDDDWDGLRDCADPDCSGEAACP